MPVWLTILASVLAAGVTYLAAPLYTRQFQVEDVRSQHLTGTTNKINDDITDLSQKVRRFESALLRNDNKKAVELREECLDSIVKLQWSLVDLRVILTQPSDEIYVTALSNSLEKLRIALDASVTSEYRPRIRSAMNGLAASTRDVLDRLYKKASLEG